MKATAANEHDVTVMSEMLHGEEERAYGDSGYAGASKRSQAIKKNKIYYKQTPILNQKAIKKWSICRKEKRIQEIICTLRSGTCFFSNKKYFQIS